MKILLTAINSKYIHTNLAIRSLAIFAKSNALCQSGDSDISINIETAEFTINNLYEEILSGIYELHPDVLLFSCYIWNWELIKKLLKDLPKILPDVPLWLGGPEVSYDAGKTIAEFPQLSGIIVGEGERTFNELVKRYQKTTDSDFSDIPGIYLKSGFTGPCAPMDMGEVPFVYTNDNISEFNNKIIYYESSRGCPFNCSYCLSSIEKGVRFRPLEMVLDELQFFLDHNVRQVKFVDRTFNCQAERSIKIWDYLISHDNMVTNFHFEIEGGILTENEINVISRMRPGLIQLEIGVQSTNPEVLKEVHRNPDISQIQKNTAVIKSFGLIHQHLDLIAGLPFEGYDSFKNSFNEVFEMHPDQLQLGFLKVLKGSWIHKHSSEYGIAYSECAPYEVLSTKWISYAEISKLKKIEEMVELYYNSGQFTAALPALLLNFKTPFDMFEALADFYEANGFFKNSPARVYRYNILLEFAIKHAIDREIFSELLTYDMYLRENCKSRPDFASDLKPFEKDLRSICPDKKMHADVFHYPVWEVNYKTTKDELKEFKEKADCLFAVCFDYTNRSPLTNNAHINYLRLSTQFPDS